jgi:hypothetical protein
MFNSDETLFEKLFKADVVEELEIDDMSLWAVSGGVNNYARACTSSNCTGSCDSTGC